MLANGDLPLLHRFSSDRHDSPFTANTSLNTLPIWRACRYHYGYPCSLRFQSQIRVPELRQTNPFLAPISFPLQREDAYALVAALTFELLGDNLEASLERISASIGIAPTDRAMLDQAVRSVRLRCIASLAEDNRRLRHLIAPKCFADQQDEREGTADDPFLPLLREILKESDDPLSITWLLRRFNIPYGRGGRLTRILEAERRALARSNGDEV